MTYDILEAGHRGYGHGYEGVQPGTGLGDDGWGQGDLTQNWQTWRCRIRREYINSLTWADDLVIFTLSNQNVQSILNPCLIIAKKLN